MQRQARLTGSRGTVALPARGDQFCQSVQSRSIDLRVGKSLVSRKAATVGAFGQHNILGTYGNYFHQIFGQPHGPGRTRGVYGNRLGELHEIQFAHKKFLRKFNRLIQLQSFIQMFFSYGPDEGWYRTTLTSDHYPKP